MFAGTFDHTLDNKGRLTIPSRFRDELASGLIITQGFDKGSLLIYPRAEWDILADKVAKLPTVDPMARMLTRYLFAFASDVIPDRQGRVLIPQNLRKLANIDSDITVVGVQNRVELWNPDKWQEINAKLEENFEDFAAQIQALGI